VTPASFYLETYKKSILYSYRSFFNHHTMAQPKSRVPLYLGVAAAGGVGYYLYTAGGNPKVAEKQFESMSLMLHVIVYCSNMKL
jgi:hypothetical protein